MIAAEPCGRTMYTAITLHKLSDVLRIYFGISIPADKDEEDKDDRRKVARAKSELDFGGIAEDRSGSYNKRFVWVRLESCVSLMVSPDQVSLQPYSINYDEKEEGRAMKAAHRRNRNGVFCFHGGVMALDMKISDKEPLICLCFCFRGKHFILAVFLDQVH
ncbi:hypothetical protein KSS87_007246 [Heliosperma pusillum]|nr:hypothetical protein KSS87_007246 [Heliosperma pusillum]